MLNKFFRCTIGGIVLAGSLVAGLTVGSPAATAVAPTPVLSRIIRTAPFVGTSTSIKDNEGLAYVPANDTIWIVDDSTDQFYSVNRATGALGQVVTKSQFENSMRLGGTELAGSNRRGDIEAAAYDVATDRLYVFSGSCCTSSAKPTAFRLSRSSTSAAFSIDSWQPLNAPYNDFSGVGIRNGEIWGGYLKQLVHYDYVTNTASAARTLPGGSNIYGVGFTPLGSEVWISESGNKIKKYDFATNTLVPGFEYSMASFGVRDARAVEPVGNELYVSDGYDYYGSDPDAFGVRVYNVGPAIPAPVASFTTTPATGAAPLTVAFTDTSTNTPTVWHWNFGDGTSATTQHPTHQYTTPGNYDVRLTASNAGGSNISALQTIAVTPAAVTPVASFTKSASTGAAPLSVTFTDTSTHTPTSWAWNFGDGSPISTVQNPVHVYSSVGTFSITLTATNAAGSNTATGQSVSVSAAPVTPVASFTKSASSGTAPLSVSFTDTSTHVPTSWSWNFGDGTPASTARNPSHSYANPGTYDVRLTATNAAGSNTSAIQSIVVSAVPVAPVASFTKTPSSGTAPLTVAFTDTSTHTPTSWEWDFGDGSPLVTTQNPSHTFTDPGTYQVTLTATNGVGSHTSAAQSVTVNPPPVTPEASFTKSTSSGTAPLSVTFTDTSTNSPTSWSWDFGDGTALATTQNPTHVFNSAGTFDVTLTATNAAGSNTSASQTVTVVAAPVASFTKSAVAGQAPLVVDFTDTSTGEPAITDWSWNFGDGSPADTAQNPSHSFASAGTFNVTLTVTNANGSNTSAAQTVTVTAPPVTPVASFTKNATSGSAPLTVNFTDTSTNTPTSWSWNFGDGTPAVTTRNTSHVFASAGSYNVTLTATNAAGSNTSAAQMVTVTSVVSQTVTLLPTDDSYVTQASPTTTHPTGSQLYNAASPTATQRSYLKFSVASLAGPVTSAKLRLWVTDGTDNGSAWYRISNSTWTEASLTWANAPAPTGVLVGDPALVTAGTWLEFNVTAIVNSTGIYSFANVPTSVNAEKFSSRNGVSPAQLVITTG